MSTKHGRQIRRRVDQPAPDRPTRYRLEALPIEGATAREWDPPALRLADTARQGVLPFSDGSHLGPLFDIATTTTTEATP
ncbi:hypothetical protein KBZ12_10825 [Cyanobium sp. Cruz CV13-4-11]|jgi:hypothetical protein|uniref:hypothetical protein n=1 Tax=unclassified Cyanobium TaxID=2627006 RepID=UPI0020CD02E7|nr:MULTISPECIES: hypothetical protein [unclassified Cyanobium]MCP9901737.1 hypothetical protein [Cyanobium sp. Cruz CV11-17]MCP9919963.1 hypothetical protein [Cyanobium sp. Cruz CV13-4-11]